MVMIEIMHILLMNYKTVIEQKSVLTDSDNKSSKRSEHAYL